MTGASWEEHLELVERLIEEARAAVRASDGDERQREEARLSGLERAAATARMHILEQKGKQL